MSVGARPAVLAIRLAMTEGVCGTRAGVTACGSVALM